MKHVLPTIMLGLCVVLALALTACGAAADAEPTPPTIHYGEDLCELCNMIISEERHAAAYVTEDGHGHAFDDIGDMLRAHREMQEEVTAFFVHDYEDRAWIRAETAHYVLSANLTTPMASGLAAFSAPEGAKALAAELQGQVLTFDELKTHYQDLPRMTTGVGGEQDLHDQEK
jgi:nitrous oxide reductase accessory protein NosL